ncbi:MULTISPECIES: hypothetical protein [Sphingobium]|uniref:hypothetical protein n=1 Tax=Sphingobium sp. MI1205 TaxID=407020 RepID=UPI00076FF66B|nr:hypothetical protein [Sphingobium sp. MI1205]AMK17022.1 TonB-dependent heme/hemoglobin receptor family protein [Sphingobium sp. MI1205]
MSKSIWRRSTPSDEPSRTAFGPAKGFEFRIAADNLFGKYYRRHLSALAAEGQSFKFTVANSF